MNVDILQVVQDLVRPHQNPKQLFTIVFILAEKGQRMQSKIITIQ